MSLYQEELLDHYWHPAHRGTLGNPSFFATVENPLCGDTMTLMARVEHSVLTDIKFMGNGCAISQVAASLLTNELIQKNLEYARAFSAQQLCTLLQVPLTPAREKCAFLALTALHKGIALYAHD